MNINRKIQLTAAAVIANGMLALGLLSPRPAVAATCSPIRSPCLPGALAQCAADGTQFCRFMTPAGCTYVGDECLGTQGCPPGFVIVECFYH